MKGYSNDGIEVFRRFFDQIVERCQQARLVWGRELYIDGTKVQANASRDSLKPRFFVEAHLADLFAPETHEPPGESNQQTLQAEGVSSESAEQEEAAVPRQLPVSIPQELQEELSRQNTERHDWILQLGAQDRRVTSRGYQRMADYLVSTTVPSWASSSRFVLETGHPKLTLPMIAPLEYRCLSQRPNRPTVPSHFTSAMKNKLGVICKVSASFRPLRQYQSIKEENYEKFLMCFQWKTNGKGLHLHPVNVVAFLLTTEVKYKKGSLEGDR